MTDSINKQEIVDLFRTTFKGRQDVVANKSGKIYHPLCSNAFKTGICPRATDKTAKCKHCDKTDYTPLTDTLIESHLNGKYILGVYPLLSDGTCNFIAADFDNHDGQRNPLRDVSEYHAACGIQGIDCYVLRSQSGKGYHVYIFFDKAVPAAKARKVAFALLKEAGVVGIDASVSSFDRLFPNQDVLPSGGVGNLIAYPFQNIRRKDGHTFFLDPETDFQNPYKDQPDVMKNIKRVTEDDLDAIIKDWELNTVKTLPQATTTTATPTPAAAPVNTKSTITVQDLMICDFLKWAHTNQKTISEPLWFAMLSNVSRISPGGISLCHQFSSDYPNYSRKDTDEKILHAMDGSHPQTCKHIKDSGYTCQKTCPVKSPAELFTKGQSLPVTQSLSPLSIIPSAPVLPSVNIPAGWTMTSDGAIEVEHSKYNATTKQYETYTEEILPIPLFIQGRMENIINGDEHVRITWYRNVEWKSKMVEKKMISDTRAIVDLSNCGVPVNSLNAKDIVKFLHAYDNHNYNYIPASKVSSQLGWQLNSSGYLLGDTYYTVQNGDLKVVNFDEASNGSWDSSWIVFNGDDDGNNQFAKGFSKSGTYEKWIEAVKNVAEYPVAMSTIYFSLLPPVLEIFGAANFTVDYNYTTSVGKSTSLRLGASTWGCPDERTTNSILGSWKTTQVGVERVASMLNGLPLYLDDTKLAGTGAAKTYGESMISQVIYMIAAGIGKNRGSVSGLRGRGSWRTVLLTSGETPAVSSTQDGGQRSRVISLWGYPFGKATSDTATIVNELNEAVVENYGHAGPKWISYILQNKANSAAWKLQYQDNRSIYKARAGAVDNPVAIRISEYFALLATVIPLIHEALPELKDINYQNIIDTLWDMAITKNDEMDMATKALSQVYEWAVANQDKFYERHTVNGDGDPRVPYNGWAGKWVTDDWEYIAFTRNTIESILRDHNHDVSATINTFHDRGWLATDKSGKGKSVNINGSSLYCRAITREAIEVQVLSNGNDEDNG